MLMAIFSTVRLTSALRRFPSRRMMRVGVAVLAVSFVVASRADAGVMVAGDSEPVARDAIPGGLAGSPTPVPDKSSPRINEWQGVPLFDGSSPTSGGAGSQTNSGGSSLSVIALVSESPRTAQSSVVSRLALCSRISLPSPLEDRFFRPPRV